MNVRMNVRMDVRMCVNASMHECTYECTYKCTYVRINVRLLARLYVEEGRPYPCAEAQPWLLGLDCLSFLPLLHSHAHREPWPCAFPLRSSWFGRVPLFPAAARPSSPDPALPRGSEEGADPSSPPGSLPSPPFPFSPHSTTALASGLRASRKWSSICVLDGQICCPNASNSCSTSHGEWKSCFICTCPTAPAFIGTFIHTDTHAHTRTCDSYIRVCIHSQTSAYGVHTLHKHIRASAHPDMHTCIHIQKSQCQKIGVNWNAQLLPSTVLTCDPFRFWYSSMWKWVWHHPSIGLYFVDDLSMSPYLHFRFISTHCSISQDR